jgi:hypothetical protein
MIELFLACYPMTLPTCYPTILPAAIDGTRIYPVEEQMVNPKNPFLAPTSQDSNPVMPECHHSSEPTEDSQEENSQEI